MKINNKGVTLIELIISFAIVGVAIIYFFQTLYTVKKIYSTAMSDTNKFVDKDYAIRIIDEYIEKNKEDLSNLNLNSLCNKYSLKYGDESCQSITISLVSSINVNDGKIYKINVTNRGGTNSGGTNYYFYKFISD